MRVPGDRSQGVDQPRGGRGRPPTTPGGGATPATGWPWRTGLKPPGARQALDPARVRRLAELTSPAFAAAAAGAAADGALPTEAAHRSRLNNQFVRQAAYAWAARALRQGIPVLCLGDLGNVAQYADDPDARPLSEAELLVRGRDRGRLEIFLERHGLAVGQDAALAPDGSVRLVLRTAAAPWPLGRVLDAEALFADSRPATVDRLRIRVPSPTHALLLATAQAAQARFSAGALPAVLDAAAILRRAGNEIDWPALIRTARRGGVRAGVGGCFALLHRLGLTGPAVPELLRRPLRGGAAAELDRVVADFESLFAGQPTRWARFRRHWLLSGGPVLAVLRGWR